MKRERDSNYSGGYSTSLIIFEIYRLNKINLSESILRGNNIRLLKNIFLLPVIGFFGIFVLINCTKTNDQATTTGKNNEAPKEVSPNQTFSIEELVDRATADKDNWQGKEVTVSGYVSYMPSSDGANGYVVHMSSKHNSDASQWQLSCKVPQGDLPEGIISKTIEVKGKIGLVHRQSYLNLKSVTLDPCEIIK